MGEHAYHDWWGSPEPCPALYIELTRPNESVPFEIDLIAALDTGAPLTAVPWRLKDTANLHPVGRRWVEWAHYSGYEPTYMVRVAADEYFPQLVEILFHPYKQDYALIGRNLMRYWHVTLKGPQQILQITIPET